MLPTQSLVSRIAIAVACLFGVIAFAPTAGAEVSGNVIAETDTQNRKESVAESTKQTQSTKNTKTTKKQPKGKFLAEGTKLGMMFLPSLKVRSRMVEGVTDAMFDLGMGHWPGTAMPGQRGNAVYGGHRTSGPAPLYHVNKLKKGDPIIILRGLKRYKYVVTTKFVVKPTAVWITRQSSKSMLTLFSCHPLHSTKRRYIVQATLVK